MHAEFISVIAFRTIATILRSCGTVVNNGGCSAGLTILAVLFFLENNERMALKDCLLKEMPLNILAHCSSLQDNDAC